MGSRRSRRRGAPSAICWRRQKTGHRQDAGRLPSQVCQTSERVLRSPKAGCDVASRLAAHPCAAEVSFHRLQGACRARRRRRASSFRRRHPRACSPVRPRLRGARIWVQSGALRCTCPRAVRRCSYLVERPPHALRGPPPRGARIARGWLVARATFSLRLRVTRNVRLAFRPRGFYPRSFSRPFVVRRLARRRGIFVSFVPCSLVALSAAGTSPPSGRNQVKGYSVQCISPSYGSLPTLG